MIPPFDEHGNLPPGIHWATWEQVVARFGASSQRRALLAGFRSAIAALRAADCLALYLGGSFVTSELEPADYDGCWELAGVDAAALDETFRGDDSPAKVKEQFGGTLYPVNAIPDPSWAIMLEWFQYDREGHRKGVVALDLRSATV
jgi:hypothetical protein